jgi:hypothetical protein
LFSNTVVFQDDVPLEEQVRIFSQPLAEFFKKAYPNISKTDPMVYLATLLIGIYLAKTHPTPAVLNVARHLDQDLGVGGIEEMAKKFVSDTPNLQDRWPSSHQGEYIPRMVQHPHHQHLLLICSIENPVTAINEATHFRSDSRIDRGHFGKFA